MRHDFTPYFNQLQWLARADGGIEIAHHFANVGVGDLVLWGENEATALTLEVVAVSTVPDLQDFWVARLRRTHPVVYLAGERLVP